MQIGYPGWGHSSIFIYYVYMYHFFYYYYNYYYFFFFWGGGGQKILYLWRRRILWTLLFCSFLCIYRGFLKFKVHNRNTLCRYLNQKYFLGMPDIPDTFLVRGGGGGGGGKQ